MTCIIGLRRGSHIWIGGDSTGISDDGWGGIVPIETPKVWKIGPFVFGSSGSWRAIQVVQHKLEVNKLLSTSRHPNDRITEKFMVRDLVPAIRRLLEEQGFSEKKNEKSSQGAEFLIGVNDKLFLFQSDYAVVEISAPFTAIGSGQYVATGALEILTQNTRLNSTTIITRALEATDKHLNTVGPPGKS